MTGKTAGCVHPTSASVATSARREVRRAVDTMLSEFGGQTATLLRTTASDLPGMNTVSPEQSPRSRPRGPSSRPRTCCSRT